MEFLFLFMIFMACVVFTVYKFLSLPVLVNLIYLHYGAKVAKDIIQEVKRPTHAPLREIDVQ